MGFLDVFTGDSAKKAAEENTARLGSLKTEGLGYLDAGKTGALGALDTAKGYFSPLTSLAGKYGAGTNLYLDSLGVNGAAGNANAVNSFQAGPGYQFGVDQSLNALDRRAASRGMLGSGNNTLDTLSTVTGLANQEYGGWQNRLAGLISPELSATTTAATGLAGLEAGKAPIYTNDANSRVNLASGVTSGINSQATQAANAEMQGSANSWGAIMQGIKMAAGAAGGMPGGTSMLGGGGVDPIASNGGVRWIGAS